jgi:hypothetical protein
MRSSRRIGVIGVVLAVALVPALAFASHPDGFEDVPDSNVFHDDIEWMAETGVTKGCNPPDNTEYCPDRALIRGEEAAFFHRYDGYLRGSLEPRLLPENCDAGQVASYDGTVWVCSDPAGGEPVVPVLSAAVGEPVTVDPGATGEAVATCAEGELAIAGSVNPLNDSFTVTTSLDGATATMTIDNTAGAEVVVVTPYAICASA